MRYAFVSAALVATVAAHGVVTSVEGANGVSMPGLSGKQTFLGFSKNLASLIWS